MKKAFGDLFATLDLWLAEFSKVQFIPDEATAKRARVEIVLRLILAGVADEARAIGTGILQTMNWDGVQNSKLLDTISSYLDRLDAVIDSVSPSACLFPLTRPANLTRYIEPAANNVSAFQEWISHTARSVTKTIANAPGIDVAGLFYERYGAIGKNKRGIVYTPAPVCDFVVNKAIGLQLACFIEQARDGVAHRDRAAITAAIARLADFSVLDPACGTGPFLVEALRLLDTTRKKMASITNMFVPGSLLSQVHGIDEDPLAVGIARFNVCLAAIVLSKARDSIQEDGASSIVEKSIVSGNAITDLRFQVPGNRFDAVVGNPPYVNYKKYLDRIDRRFLEKNFRVFDGQADLSYYFFELHARLLKDGGTSGQVSSRYFMQASHARRLREFLAGYEIVEIVDMNDCDIFGGIGIHPLLFFFKGCRAVPGHGFVYRDVSTIGSGDINRDVLAMAVNEAPAKRIVQSMLDASGWCMLSTQELTIKAKFEKYPSLGELGDVLGGAETGHDEAFARHVVQERGEYFGIHSCKRYPLDSELVHPWLKNGDIRGYHHAGDRWCIYVPPDIDEATFKARYPKSFAFLSCFKADLEGRDNGTIQVPWYAWRRPRNVKNLDAGEKIVIPYKAPRLRASIDTARSYCSYDVTIFVPRLAGPSLLYIAGVLNSLPAFWYFATQGKRMGSIYEFYSGPFSKVRVPIPDAEAEQEMVGYVQKAMSVAQRLYRASDGSNDRTTLQRELETIQASIDDLVFRMIGVNLDDIAAIHASVDPRPK